MADQTLLDYAFTGATAANPDSTFQVAFQRTSATAGPGSTPLGQLDDAVDLGARGTGMVDISALAVNAKQFCVRVVFQANGPVTARQNLVESNRLPFALFLVAGDKPGEVVLVGTVNASAHGWRGPRTRFRKILKSGVWYTADLAYDLDTAALFVDGEIVAVHAFPSGAVATKANGAVFFGSWVDRRRNHFNGKLAGFRLHAGIPEAIEAALDERRTHPEWFITHKREAIREQLSFGNRSGDIQLDSATGAHIQHYQHGGIMYHDSVGAAFEMHGAIYAKYKALGNRSQLGYLASDEGPTNQRGGRKSVFSTGAIYWSNATGANLVTGQIYLDFESFGATAMLGFPTRASQSVAGGRQQIFQGGRMYFHPSASNAHEVHGGILARYLELGGPVRFGFPTSNESDVKKNNRRVGRFSDFTGGTIYWSARTGAHDVRGSILRAYRDTYGGPPGDLGFPTSSERSIPGASGTMNTFQKGSLMRFGGGSPLLVRPFKLFLGRIQTRESEGFGMGQNDIYVHVSVKQGSREIFKKRYPSSGDFSGKNNINLDKRFPVLITPNDPNMKITFRVKVMDADPGSDDHLGTWTKTLDASTAWGLRDNGGILRSGSFSKIRSMTMAVQPDVDVSTLTETEKWWGVTNEGTDHLTRQQYAAAFRDVDSDTEWWDLGDHIDTLFYELVIDTLAKDGNCFGMSLEGIYARKGSSPFSMPLDRFTDWNVVRPEFNLKHQYQVGASAIWWFVGQFLSGNTHDPRDVFVNTRNLAGQGNHPVVCISQNYDFSGAPHCILPVAWDTRRKPWRLRVLDPNDPGDLRTLTVDPDDNTFRYEGVDETYTGGAWSGGRFHYMPFSVLCERPRTPIWDAILLLLAGTIVILADGVETTSITDGSGNDVDGFGDRATTQLQQGGGIEDYFVGFKGYERIEPVIVSPIFDRPVITFPAAVRAHRGAVPGELLMRRGPVASDVVTPVAVDPSVIATLPIASVIRNRGMGALASAVGTPRGPNAAIFGRTLHAVANDSVAMAALDPNARDAILSAANAPHAEDFDHAVRGKRNGRLGYFMRRPLSQLHLDSTIQAAEANTLEIRGFGTSAGVVRLDAPRNKQVNLRVENKLGAGGDRIDVTIERLPVAPGQKLELNMKPGLGGIELFTTGQRVNAPVTVRARIGTSTIERRFNVPVEGGARLKLSTVLSEPELGVARIDRLFGPSHDAISITGTG